MDNYVASEDLNKESDYAEAMFALADLDGLDLCRHEDFFYDLCRIQRKAVSDHISEDVRESVWDKTYMYERIRVIGQHLHFPKKMQNALNEVSHDFNSYDD